MGVHHVPLFLVVILGSFLQTRQAIVKSCQHTDVLLPCNCSGIVGEIKWQKDDTPVYSNKKNSKINNYTGRITKVPDENSKDCSIGLKNILEEDGGTYTCNFPNGSIYSINSVALIVIINSTECPVTASSVKGDNSTSNNSPSTHSPEVYIPLIIISALLLVGCIFAFLRIRLRNQPRKTDEEDCKNPGTLSEDSSDKKCLQAPLILALCYRADMDQEKERPHCLL